MKIVLLMLLVVGIAVAPLYLRQTNNRQLTALDQRLAQVENELREAQQDIGNLKQEILILQKRDLPND